MSSWAHRLAMSKLARVQAVSHGHPVTSGMPTVDYYVSWQAAELPIEVGGSRRRAKGESAGRVNGWKGKAMRRWAATKGGK